MHEKYFANPKTFKNITWHLAVYVKRCRHAAKYYKFIYTIIYYIYTIYKTYGKEQRTVCYKNIKYSVFNGSNFKAF